MQNGRKLSTKITIATTALLLATSTISARSVATNNNGNKGGGTTPTPAAGCAPAAAVAILEFNNVRARLETTGGTMFQDRGAGIAAYSIPKQIDEENDPYYAAIYAAGLWIGGTDQNGQLKVAAAMFRQGNDFWPGPLDDATADVDAATCNIFDQYFAISRAEVNQFVAWFANPDAYPDYQIPKSILNYPAKGNVVTKQAGQTYTVTQDLAPFFDADGDTYYDPSAGDYPKYDLLGQIDCRVQRDLRLFGDTTIWFVFNDKGNQHSESQSDQPIGMEIHGQAFAFATNDEINDMTFYNYELINKSSFTFTNTYFGQWVDSDLGNPGDDYVGCDASRGLGYCYNGDNDDDVSNTAGVIGYGSTPPAIGVDFFEGPYADNDGIDNPLTTDIPTAIAQGGIPYEGLGIGYGDGIVDNERYGMKKFVYYNIGAQINGNGDPNNASDFYNYLQGKWTNGNPMVWGGDGNPLGTGTGSTADLIFPGDTDPYFWSTQGVAQTPSIWDEKTVNNTAGDRRFLESAGPFTLEPGAVNDLTVGIVYARALSGDEKASLTYLRVADDKAQALFDNCFKVLDGPAAPDITIQELKNELILYLSNNNPISNNYNETAHLKDPTISIPDTLDGVYQGPEEDRDSLKYYDFQGYQVYQVKNANVSVTQLSDPSVARLIAQCDKEDGISQIVNYTFDKSINANVPTEMVAGENKGIRHSFRVTTDAFATGTDKKLVNHKTYHFIVIAYAYNNWKTVDPQNFTLGGQLKPYLASRTNSTGSSIRSYSGIPHDTKPENGGTLTNSNYGDQPEITRIEGQGNGGLLLNLTSSSEATILSNGYADYITYQSGYGPVDVKVIDPLNVASGTYQLQFLDSTATTPASNTLDDAYWRLIFPSASGSGYDTVLSDVNIANKYEQLFLDQGISVTLKQVELPGTDLEVGGGMISSSISYALSGQDWLGAMYDLDGQNDLNWIRSGTQAYNVADDAAGTEFNDYIENGEYLDPNQLFENIIQGSWAPYRLVATSVSAKSTSGKDLLNTVKFAPAILDHFKSGSTTKYYSTVDFTLPSTSSSVCNLSDMQSVDIVFTSDQSKWTRSVVFETGRDGIDTTEGHVPYFAKRFANSVDKNGNDDGTGTTGLGWFPGYAINVETGERLNIAFGEDSGLPNQNGRDMKMNPTSRLFDFDTLNLKLDTVMGGRHYVYIFKTRYDECKTLDSLLSITRTPAQINSGIKNTRLYIAQNCIWTGVPMLNQGQTWLSTDARVQLRVERPYEKYSTVNSTNAEPTGNATRPMYMFTMDGFAAETGVSDLAKEALKDIKAVPNPYYAYSEYESDKLDTRIKFTNLPEECTVSIYNVNGTLMRRFQKADSKTSLDWDLKNSFGIPVAGGVYLIHIDVPGIGEKVIKWYGVTRPTDLGGF
ncbi:MAG: T9SS C-terminal target domain-containing protein [Flavobacteriales bacterium]|nr:T9SS C-terminal target domain-containing protein [Flavobacteriales bacterium]